MTDESLMLLLDHHARRVENYLKTFYFEDEDVARLLNAEQYSLFAGGKRIRPVLCLCFNALFGGEEKSALPFAGALEMLHTYSLIHDDLPCMDDDDLRRGKPTCHKAFDEATAVLAGDALLTGAFELLAQNEYVTPDVRNKAVGYLASSAGRYGMVGGQMMDLLAENTPISADKLLKMHSLKTGALITASCVLGALSAGVTFTDKRMEDVLYYAENIGLVFQMVDDLLDAEGDVATLGKAVHADEKMHKTNFLTFYTPEETRKTAEMLTEKAKEALSEYEGNEALCALADYLLKRKK